MKRRRGKELFAIQPRHAKQTKSTCSIQVGRLDLWLGRCKHSGCMHGAHDCGVRQTVPSRGGVRPASMMVDKAVIESRASSKI